MIDDLILSAKSSWSSLYDNLLKIKFGRLKTCRGCEDKKTQEKVKDIRNKVKKQLQDDIKKKVISYNDDEIISDLINLYPIMKSLTDLVLKFMNRYAEAKKERGIIDFNDFEHFCLEILGNEEVSLKLKQRYVEILVDEYQDSNYVQEAIINAIARQDEKTGKYNNVFMVGDVKQSIYRFRQDRKSTRLNSSHANISYAVFCLKKKTYLACDSEQISAPERSER